jgi:hypothetical protein
VADSPAGPVVPVLFDEQAIAEDLHHLPGGARVALDAFRRELERIDGLPMTRVKRCDAEGRDGTNLGGCLKTYVPCPPAASDSSSSRPPTRPGRSRYVRLRSVSVTRPEVGRVCI